MDSAGNVYVPDEYNHTIRMVTANGVVTTLAGSAGFYGAADGMGTAAKFYFPCGIAVDSATNLYVATYGNHTIRKVTPVGTNWLVTTLAGSAGNPDSTDGIGGGALFKEPTGVAVDSLGSLYVADSGNNRITKGTPVYRPVITLQSDQALLSVSWLASNLGWVLEAQINAVGLGFDTNWFPVFGSTTNTEFEITNPASPSVFYRLRFS